LLRGRDSGFGRQDCRFTLWPFCAGAASPPLAASVGGGNKGNKLMTNLLAFPVNEEYKLMKSGGSSTSFELPRPLMTFRFTQFVPFRSRSFFDLPSFLILTVFDEQAHMGTSERIDDGQKVKINSIKSVSVI
jgi:hypothetical protein